VKRIGILFSTKISEAQPLASEIFEWLSSRQIDVWVGSPDETVVVQEMVPNTELIVVLGGDGTTLMSARIASSFDVPIFGINLGRVGFLSEADPPGWETKLSRVLAGDYWLEKRLMLRAEVVRNNKKIGSMVALNDIVVSRGAQVRMVRFHLSVDGDPVITYMADGLITSTPTGSTAYSMAAGGPILPPQLPNFLVIPVAPHLSFQRPLVLHQEAIVKITVEMEHEGIATADGQDAFSLRSGDDVVISKHACDSIFARVDGASYFYHRLMQRLSFWSLKN
jgi:NAD+ kinase